MKSHVTTETTFLVRENNKKKWERQEVGVWKKSSQSNKKTNWQRHFDDLKIAMKAIDYDWSFLGLNPKAKTKKEAQPWDPEKVIIEKIVTTTEVTLVWCAATELQETIKNLEQGLLEEEVELENA